MADDRPKPNRSSHAASLNDTKFSSKVNMPGGVPGFEYKGGSSSLPQLNRQNINSNDDEEIELGLNVGGALIQIEKL